MKKIGIDARLYWQTGVGVYLRNLIYYLERTDNRDINFYIYLTKKDFEKTNFKNRNFVKRKADYHWHSFAEQIGFLRLLEKDDLDLMHFPYFSYPIFYRKKFLATVHDLTPIYYKTGKASTQGRLYYEIKHRLLQTVLRRQVFGAEKIITPTESTKNELLGYFGAQIKDKILTIYEGVNHELTGIEENRELRKRFQDSFFIYVGNFYPHKNVEGLIEAFSSIEDQSCRLILVGPDDYFVCRLSRRIEAMGLSKRVSFYHQRSAGDLVFFYKNAKGLIHPSLSEGFGLPLLEAAHFNLPVIASNIPPFREILKDRFLAFDPRSIEDMRNKINFFNEKEPVFDYRPLLKKYSFKKMAREILDCYLNLMDL